ncbi:MULTISPECIES: glycosyltransferase family 4 protein [Acinetobacter]|uniref:glycosyltransferase family 4 protein n=1 Tax=Acinetobacter TaxID=469 RepID=UPI00051C3B29|nr:MULTISPECIES: glycosyltransferase family 4 protein [Acinetobacter]MCH7379677.1 glycosyltransferase family 4 protein [Acinetobacter higginsii]
MTTPAIWFPAVRTNSGSDKFTEQLVIALNKNGIRAEITWLPHYAEYLPWLVKAPTAPEWANIIHINTWLPSKFYPKNLPIVATLHHCVQDKNFSPYKTKLQKLYHFLWITPIEKKSIQHATIITTVSQYTANCAKEIFDISNIEVIYNGVDLDIFNPVPRNEKKENQKFSLLFVGNNSIRKGFDLLPRIMEQLGDDYELFYTAKSAEKLPSNMKQLPYQKSSQDLANVYRSMDALLFPSRLEGFGLVVAEAMACGLPVVVANSSALPELIDHGVSGFICQKDNILDFTKKIRKLRVDQNLQKKISNAATTYIHKNFNIQQTIDAYIKIYIKLLADR